jgi:hypothetical protein
MSYRTAVLLLLVATTTASAFSSTSLAFVSGHNANTRREISTAKAKQQQGKQQLSPLFAAVDPTDFVPMAIFAGAAALTIYQQQQTVKNAVGDKDDATTATIPTPVAKAPVPAPAPVAVTPKVEVTPPAPAPAPVPAPVAVAPKPAPAPAPVPVAVAPKPAPAPVPAPPPVKKDLVREYGSTIEDRKETEKVVQENKAKATAKAEAKNPKKEEEAAADVAAAAEAAVVPVVPVDVTSTLKKSGSKRRKAWRVVKKVVAPWRKWDSIN